MADKNIIEYYADLDQYAKAFCEIADRIAKPFGGTGVDAYILGSEVIIAMSGNEKKFYTQNDLVKEWTYPKQTVHSAVERLKKKGYLTLEPIPGNKKEKAIILTDEGRRIVHEYIEPWINRFIRAMERMHPDERDMLSHLMGKYLSYLEEEVN